MSPQLNALWLLLLCHMAVAVLATTDNLTNMVCKLTLRCFLVVPSLARKALPKGASRQDL